MTGPLLVCFAALSCWHLWRCGRTWQVAGRGAARDVVDGGCHAAMSIAMVAMLLLGDGGGDEARIAQVVGFGLAAGWFLLGARATPGRWHDAVAMAAMVWMLVVMDGGAHGHRAGAFAVSPAGQVTFVLVGLLGFGAVRHLIDGADLALHADRRVDDERRPRDPLLSAVMSAGMALALAPMVAAA